MEEDELLRIASAQEAAAARTELRALEKRFRMQTAPADKQHIAREIVRLRAALTNYRLRTEMRQVHYEEESHGPTPSRLPR